MSTVIHVNPNELEAVASTLKSHMREMDEAIRSACDALGSVGGSAKGLDGVRDSARQLYRSHTSKMNAGDQVVLHISTAAAAFKQSDQEMSDAVRSIAVAALGAATLKPISQSVFEQTASAISSLAQGFVSNLEAAVPEAGVYLGMAKDGFQIASDAWNTFKSDFEPYAKKITEIADFVKDSDLFEKGSVYQVVTEKIAGVGHVSLNSFSHVEKILKYGKPVTELTSALYQGIKTGEFGDFHRATDSLISKVAFNAVDSYLTKAGTIATGIIACAVIFGGGKVTLGVAGVTGLVWLGAKGQQWAVKQLGSGLEYIGATDAAEKMRTFGQNTDLVGGTENLIKGIVSATTNVIADPQKAYNQATGFLHEKLQQVSDFVEPANKWVDKGVEIYNKAEEILKKLPAPTEWPPRGQRDPFPGPPVPGVVVF